MAGCGRYSMRVDDVVHRIENSLFAEWIGDDRLRGFEFEDDTIRLVGDAGGLVQHLPWQRVT